MSLNNNFKNRYVKNFRKDKNFILAIIAITFGWSVIFLFTFYNPVYKSHAKVLIKDISNQSYLMSGENNMSDLKTLTTAGNPILNQMEILNSNELSRILYNDINKIYPNEVKKVKNPDLFLKKILKAKNKYGTDTIEISLVWKNPYLAQDFLKIALNEYENINLNINKEIKTNRRKYIEQKLVEVDDKLLNEQK